MTDRDDATEQEPDGEPTKREGRARSERPWEPEQLVRGTLLGRYVVLDVLGEGGMGVVYSAFDPELDRKVAVKLLQASTGEATVDDQAWLVREAQALARLAHPNVVAVYDVGTLSGDRVFVAMELVDGVTLRTWLEAKPRSWREVLPVMIAAGRGLAAAHTAGLVHRDFKPDNVLVGNDGRVRVMDFGLARLQRDGNDPAAHASDLDIEARSPLSERLTLLGAVVGTPAYMAPEIRGSRASDAHADQFSFGVTLYEALFRARPYSKQDLKEATSATKPKTPPNVGVPSRIQRVVLRAIEVDDTKRYASMDELLAELSIDPTAPRRRALIASGIVLACAALVGGTLAASRARVKDRPCQRVAGSLAGVWDAATKQVVGAAFAATKRPYAARSFAGVERALDAYAASWIAAAVESCEATRIRGDQTEEVLALRTTCFDQRLVEVHALTELLATADPSVVELGDKVVFGLEPVAVCANVSVLRAAGLPPPETKVVIDELAKKLAEAKADLVAGKYFAGLVAAKAAVDGATKVHWMPIAAEGLIVRGAALLATGNAEEAEHGFAEATWAAMRGKRDDIVAQGALSSAMLLAVHLGKPEEAQLFVDLGEAAAVRVGVDRAIELRRFSVEGVVAAARGDLNLAVTLHEKALAVGKLTFGPDSPELMFDELDLGTTLTKAGAHAKAAPHYEHALALREASVGPDHPDIALILTDLGVSYRHMHRDKEARAAFERALAIRERTFGKQSPLLIATLDNSAEFLREVGDVPAAIANQQRAIAIAKLVPGTANPMYHQLATDYAETLIVAGRLADAHAIFDEVMALEVAGHSSVLPATQTSRAELALAEHAWTDAAAFDERAIAGFEAAGGKDSPALWRPLAGLARAKLGLGQAAAARPLFERALAIGEHAQLDADELAPTRAALAALH